MSNGFFLLLLLSWKLACPLFFALARILWLLYTGVCTPLLPTVLFSEGNIWPHAINEQFWCLIQQSHEKGAYNHYRQKWGTLMWVTWKYSEFQAWYCYYILSADLKNISISNLQSCQIVFQIAIWKQWSSFKKQNQAGEIAYDFRVYYISNDLCGPLVFRLLSMRTNCIALLCWNETVQFKESFAKKCT